MPRRIAAAMGPVKGSMITRSTPFLISDQGIEPAPPPKLRGSGQAIGQRGRSSAGIPWRSLPVYDASGALRGTGDSSPDKRARDVPIQQKQTTQFSAKLAGGHGVREVLEPVFEVPEGATTQAASTTDDVVEAKKPNLHWTCRQQRGGVASPSNIVDTCPFSREDTSPTGRQTQPATPHRRRGLSLPPQLSGGVPITSPPSADPHAFAAERSSRASRINDVQQVATAAEEAMQLLRRAVQERTQSLQETRNARGIGIQAKRLVVAEVLAACSEEGPMRSHQSAASLSTTCSSADSPVRKRLSTTRRATWRA